MSEIRIAHLSDTHLGYRALAKADPITGRNQRTVDIEEAFGWAVDDLLIRKVDLVIHSGDLFHHPRPVFPAIATAIRQLRKVEQAGIPAYVIAGNHDTPRLRMTGSVFGLLESALPDVAFCGGYQDDQFENAHTDTVVTLIPHGRLTNPEPPAVFPVQGRRNVLVTHGFVPNMDLPYLAHEPGEEEVGEALLDSAFDYIALGHYHQFTQARSNVWYSGSTERITWSDVHVHPGYALVTLGDAGTPPQVEHVSNPNARPMVAYTVPPQVTADQDGASIADHVLQWLEKLDSPDAMTRIVLKDVPRPVRRQAESLIKKASDPFVWSVEVANPPLASLPVAERISETPSANLLEQFNQFIADGRESGLYDAPFATAFSSTGRKELEEAQAVLDAQIVAEGAE